MRVPRCEAGATTLSNDFVLQDASFVGAVLGSINRSQLDLPARPRFVEVHAMKRAILLVTLFVWPARALAWDPYGHMVVAASAWEQIGDPAVRKRIGVL